MAAREVQPALPGDVGAVREVENASPAVAAEPDFSLRAEVARVRSVQGSLFSSAGGAVGASSGSQSQSKGQGFNNGCKDSPE